MGITVFCAAFGNCGVRFNVEAGLFQEHRRLRIPQHDLRYRVTDCPVGA